jgi:arsenate reductase
MAIKVFEYSGCSTCKQALKFLDSKGIKYERVPIVEQPPTVKELKKMLEFVVKDGGDLKKLFNTSGIQYRELGIAEKLKTGMTDEEALTLLSENGKLIKRPFLLATTGGTVGFKPEAWGKLV